MVSSIYLDEDRNFPGGTLASKKCNIFPPSPSTRYAKMLFSLDMDIIYFLTSVCILLNSNIIHTLYMCNTVCKPHMCTLTSEFIFCEMDFQSENMKYKENTSIKVKTAKK